MSVKIVVADDLHVNRKAQVFKLLSRPDYEICAEAANGQVALVKIKFHHPDVLLLDLNMPVMDGFQVLETLQKENSPVKTIAVSMNDSPQNVSRCFQLGARGFLSLSNETDEEETAIDSVMENGFYFNGQTNFSLLKEIVRLKRFEPHFTSQVIDFDADQLKLLRAFARQLSNAEIEKEICASDSTVERLKKEMVDKLKVKNFLSVFVYALQKGIINLDEIPVQSKSKAA